MIDTSLLQDFIAETTEHLEEMEENLLLLEKTPENSELINSIFRSVHTIKGSAEYLGMEKISSLTHNLESLLDRIRNGNKQISPAIIDVAFTSGDVVSRLIEDLAKTQKEQTPIDEPLARILHLLDQEIQDAPEPEDATSAEPDLTLNEEAYDEELYVIFVQNLREGLTEFNHSFASIATSGEPQGVLDRCAELIDSLAASANYMGYDQLSSLYDDLTADLKSFRKGFSEPAGTQSIEQIVAVVNHHIAEICNLFDIDVSDLGAPVCASHGDPLTDRSVPVVAPGDRPEDLALEVETLVFNEDLMAESSERDHPSADPAEDGGALPEESSSPTSYEEDYDAELFDIFISQLIEDLGWFKCELEAMDGAADHGNTIDDWKNKLAALRSSSNYMGYDTLTDIYGEWESRLDAAGSQLSDMGEDARVKVLRNDAAEMFEKIVSLFPQVDQLDHVIVAAESMEPEVAIEMAAADPSDGFAAATTPSSMLSDALSDKISQMTMHAETPHEVVTDYLFTDQIAGTPIESDPDNGSGAAVDSDRKRCCGETLQAKVCPSDSLAEGFINEAPVVEKIGVDEASDMAETKRPEHAGSKPADDAGVSDAGDGKHVASLTGRIHSRNIRVDANKIDALMNQVGELVVSRAWFSQLHHEMRDLKHKLLQEQNIDKRLSKQISQMTFRLHEATSSLGRAANELQEGVMRIRMLPVARLFNRYPRLIHDLVKDGNKQVDLEIRGEDTELDKMVIEKISDPMIHIIRNAIDHGIEKSAERNKQGKPEAARLTIEAYHESNHVVIEVTDDGRGIDPQKIRAKALEKGILDPVEIDRLTDREAIALITMPGFSTASAVTHTSGRGVGMDVVKKNIEKLNGTVEIDSIVGEETRIRIKLPLTLAIIPALLVRVASELFTIPLSTVEETIKVNARDIERIEGNEVIYLRNETIPLIRLSRVFNMATTDTVNENVFIVIVSNGMNQMGLVVDAMLGQEEVVIKPLEDYIQESSGFSGATILGDGRISLILDIYDLLNISIEKMAYRKKSKSAVVA